MKRNLSLITSILSIVSPICSSVVMCFVEQELIEAIFGGLLIGCLIGTFFGIISLITNRGESRIVSIFSITPMCPLVIYIIMLIPYLIYG